MAAQITDDLTLSLSNDHSLNEKITTEEIQKLTLDTERKTFAELLGRKVLDERMTISYNQANNNRELTVETRSFESGAFSELASFLVRKNVDIDDLVVLSSLKCTDAEDLVKVIVAAEHKFRSITLNNTQLRDKGAIDLATLLSGELGSRLKYFELSADLEKTGFAAIAAAINKRSRDYMPPLDLNLEYAGRMELAVFCEPLCKGVVTQFSASGLGFEDLRSLVLHGANFKVDGFKLEFDFEEEHDERRKEIEDLFTQLKKNFRAVNKSFTVGKEFFTNLIQISFSAYPTSEDDNETKKTLESTHSQSNDSSGSQTSLVMTPPQPSRAARPVPAEGVEELVSTVETVSQVESPLRPVPIRYSLKRNILSSTTPISPLSLNDMAPQDISGDTEGQETQSKKARIPHSPKEY
jgi:hypothetical protein